MRMRRRNNPALALLAGAVCAALVLAGCGGPAESSASSGDGSATWSSRDALLAAAEKEGSLKVLTSFTEPSFSAMLKGFETKYPFLKGKVDITEETGDDENRILLELQAGTNDSDVLHINFDNYDTMLPLSEDIDLAALAKAGVVDIPGEMINPDHPNTMAAGSGIAAITYNKKLVDENALPNTWEDLLAPEYQGRKFLIDIEPTNMATLGSIWGDAKLSEFAKGIGAQKPIFVRGDTVSITALGAGEYSLHAFSNFHSAYRAQQKAPDRIGIKVLEPVPVRLNQVESIRKGAEHPAAATLFLEYTASDEAQAILDEFEPRQSSIFSSGSSLNKLTEGKKKAVIGWKEFNKVEGWADVISKAWGFPTAELEKK